MFCLIHLKKTSIFYLWRYKLDISKTLILKLLEVYNCVIFRVIGVNESRVFWIEFA